VFKNDIRRKIGARNAFKQQKLAEKSYYKEAGQSANQSQSDTQDYATLKMSAQRKDLLPNEIHLDVVGPPKKDCTAAKLAQRAVQEAA
jgi:hypothetical protein